MSEDLTILRGDGTWPWYAQVDGDDIIVQDVRATCFGGSADPQDSGQTASGISTKANPKLAACALPRAYTGNSPALIAALGGSPIPASVPFKSRVQVTCGDVTFIVPFIDLGPGKRTGNAIDLTPAAARMINSKANARNFSATVSYRILGAAKYASATYPQS
jgi:3D (Asp-Asp-Asp) domain-containing protein